MESCRCGHSYPETSPHGVFSAEIVLLWITASTTISSETMRPASLQLRSDLRENRDFIRPPALSFQPAGNLSLAAKTNLKELRFYVICHLIKTFRLVNTPAPGQRCRNCLSPATPNVCEPWSRRLQSRPYQHCRGSMWGFPLGR